MKITYKNRNQQELKKIYIQSCRVVTGADAIDLMLAL